MRRDRAAIVATVTPALALALFTACRHRGRAPGTDAGAARVVRDPVPHAEPSVTPPSEPVLGASALSNEPPLAYAPGAPPGCTLVPPVRELHLPPGVDVVFATAIAGHRLVLAVSIGAGAHTPADASVITLVPDAPAPRFQRGPVEPAAVSLVAGAAGDRIALAWSLAGAAQTDDVPLRVAWLGETDGGAPVRTLARHPNARASDLACDATGCTLAWEWIDSFAMDESPARAAFTLLRPDAIDAPAATDFAPASAEISGALPPFGSPLRGTVRRDGRHRFFLRGGGDGPTLEGAILDVARVDDQTLALRGLAPTDGVCQPGAWRIELDRVAPDGALTNALPLAVADARPRGARIRTVDNHPLVTWLDAPQCAAEFFVIRALGNGQNVAIATAQDYDIAAVGNDVSLVLRDRDRLRWVRFHCP